MSTSSKQALPGASRMNAFAMEPEALTIIGLDTKDGPEHPLYDERVKLPLDEGRIRNVMAYGVIEPVIVRKNGPLVEVIAGRQRVRWAREANKRLSSEGRPTLKVSCMVRREGDQSAIAVMIAENENREDDDPIVRAKKAQRMLNFGNTEDDIATAFGISTQAVRNLLATLDLSTNVQKLVSEGRLAYSTAITLRDLTRQEQETQAAEMAEKGVGVAEAKRLERVRRAAKNGKPAPDPEKSARGKSVSVVKLRKVAENEEFMAELEPQARDMLRWILGDDAAAKRIKGLTALLKE